MAGNNKNKRRGKRNNWHWGFFGGLATALGIGFSEGATFKEGVANVGQNMIGYDASTAEMSWDRAKKGALPFGIGLVITILAAKSGINRYTPKWANL